MKDQLLLLLELQAIDLKVKELNAARKVLPTRTAPLRESLVRLEALLDGERQKLTDAEQWQRTQQAMQTRDQDQLRTAKSKLNGTRTGKEFHAATREVEFKKKSMHEREIEMRKVSDAVSKSGPELGERDAAIQKLRDQLVAEDAQIAVQLEEIAAQVATASAGRDDVRVRIEKGWLKAYDALIVRGVAVAPVDNGICQGCRVRIVPQQNNKLARLETIETCERCARIIYRREMLLPPAEPAADAAPVDAIPAADA